MRVPRLYLDAELATGIEIELPRDRAHYLSHVLRLTDGARLLVFDGIRPLDFEARLALAGKRARIRILSLRDNETESPLDSRLLQAVGKPDHVDRLVQKTTELGLRRLILFNGERTQTPLKGSRRDKKLQHWRAVAASACEQCGRSRLPEIHLVSDLESALQTACGGPRLMLDFQGSPLISHLVEGKGSATVTFLVGPEGGLAPREIEQARKRGFAGWRLGPRVLRMETAALTALALWQQALGDLGD